MIVEENEKAETVPVETIPVETIPVGAIPAGDDFGDFETPSAEQGCCWLR